MPSFKAISRTLSPVVSTVLCILFIRLYWSVPSACRSLISLSTLISTVVIFPWNNPPIVPHIAKNKPAILFKSHQDGTKDGEQSRDFIWIDDCIDIMLWFYKNKQVSGLFNVGTGQARSFKDLVTIIFHALDREPRIEYVNTPINIRDQYQYFTQATTQKLKDVGYEKQFTSLEDGVTQYVKNYLSTIDPYK